VGEILERIDHQHHVQLLIQHRFDQVEFHRRVGVAVDGLADAAGVEGTGLLFVHAGILGGVAVGILTHTNHDIAARGVGQSHGMTGKFRPPAAANGIPILRGLEIELLIFNAAVDNLPPVGLLGADVHNQDLELKEFRRGPQTAL